MLQLNNRNAEISFTVRTRSERFDSFVLAELCPYGGAQRTCTFSVNNRDNMVICHDSRIEEAIYHKIGIVTRLTAYIDLLLCGS